MSTNTNDAKWEKEQQELDILLQNNMLQYLSVKEVVRTLSLVSRKHYATINENVDLMVSLVGYDFGEIFESCHALKEQVLNREITNYQCLRLLYTQFDTLKEIRHSNGRLPSLSIVSTSIVNSNIRPSITMVSDNNMASVDNNISNSNSNDKDNSDDNRNDSHNKNKNDDDNNIENINVHNRKKSKINNDEMEMASKKKNTTSPIGWDFSHLIGLRKSGCVLHWLNYMQKLYQNSEHCHSPCEITCDGHGIVQIQPIANARSASLDEKLPLNDPTKILANKKEPSNQKIVLSCALDLWTLCWRKGFTAQELTKLQQGLMRFEFRRW